jgi:hypothetical protein
MKQAVMARYKVLFRHSPGQSEEEQEIRQLGWSVTWLREEQTHEKGLMFTDGRWTHRTWTECVSE